MSTYKFRGGTCPRCYPGSAAYDKIVSLYEQPTINFTLAETSEIQVIQQDVVGEGELHHPDACTH